MRRFYLEQYPSKSLFSIQKHVKDYRIDWFYRKIPLENRIR